MNRRQLLRRISRGDCDNIAFADLTSLVEGLGFELLRVRGSHHMYMHRTRHTVLNLQPDRRQAKAYQVRQLRVAVARYDLTLEDEA